MLFTVAGKFLYTKLDRNDPNAYALGISIALMPFSVIIVPLVILLNWSLAGIYITAYPVLMILQRMLTGIIRYLLHAKGWLGYEKYTSSELQTYLNSRNLGWPLLLMPFVEGLTFNAYRIATGDNTKSRKAKSSNYDISSNKVLFGNWLGIFENLGRIKKDNI